MKDVWFTVTSEDTTSFSLVTKVPLRFNLSNTPVGLSRRRLAYSSDFADNLIQTFTPRIYIQSQLCRRCISSYPILIECLQSDPCHVFYNSSPTHTSVRSNPLLQRGSASKFHYISAILRHLVHAQCAKMLRGLGQ